MEPREPVKRDHSLLAGMGLVCLFALAVYSNTLENPFQFDGRPHILDNARIRRLGNVKAIWDFWPTRFIPFYSFALDYQFYGNAPSGYRFTSLAFHAAAGCLVVWLVSLIRRTPALAGAGRPSKVQRGAVLVGVLFVVHPVQTEAVTYIYQRSTVLAAFFYLLSVSLYLKLRLRKASPDPARAILLVLSLAAGLAAMYCKENAFTLPFAVLLCELCFFRRREPAGWRHAAPLLLLLAVIPATLLWTRSGGVLRPGFLESAPGGGAKAPVGIGQRDYLLTQSRVLVSCLRMLVLPWGQNLDHDFPVSSSLLDPRVLGSVVLLALIFGFGLVSLRRRPLLAFGVLWFFLTLSVESLVPIRNVMCEYRLYLPMAGLCFVLADMIGRAGGKRRQVEGLLAVIVVLMACLAFTRNTTWRTMDSLGRDMVAKSPRKLRPHLYFGAALLNIGDYRRALACARRVIELSPGLVHAWELRGNALLEGRKYDEAIRAYSRALRIEPERAQVLYNRGVALALAGELDPAIRDFTDVVKHNPYHGSARMSLGNAYMLKGESRRAIEQYTEAVRLRPGPDLFRRRARAYLAEGDYEAARGDYERFRESGGRDRALEKRLREGAAVPAESSQPEGLPRD